MGILAISKPQCSDEELEGKIWTDMKRDDKGRPQVTGLCLKALAGEGVVSVHQHIVLDSTSVHMFFGLRIGDDICRQSRSLRRSGAKVETDL